MKGKDFLIEALEIKDADLNMVSTCQFLRNLSGFSGWGGPIGIDNSKNDVREQAVKLNATHIVWQNIATTGGVADVFGNVYRCG
ncbi:MAG: hypothetical protein HWE27_11075 [Gammaproteobacteria bacterium]|nr:hypothetical protein [Gammaproteobacteria bacterium]